MPTYVMLTNLTAEGIRTLKNNPNRVGEVNKEVEQIGAKVLAQYATLGQYDFVTIVEAPDEQTMAKVSVELGSRGTMSSQTLAAIPALPGAASSSGARAERASARTIACSRPPPPATRIFKPLLRAAALERSRQLLGRHRRQRLARHRAP